MDARSRSVTLLAVTTLVVGACVPAPAGRPTPGPTEAPATPAPTVAPSPTGPTPIPSFIRPTPTPLPTFLTYAVRPGDTMSSIARAFETDVDSIAYWNRDAYPSLDPDTEGYRPDRIEVGWTLVLIPGVRVDLSEVPERTPTPAPTATEGATAS